MSHLDEGTLHALLDGELELAEVREIQTHLGTCAACDSRLQDVKQFLAEADRLVGALEAPAGSSRSRPEPAPPPSAGRRHAPMPSHGGTGVGCGTGAACCLIHPEEVAAGAAGAPVPLGGHDRWWSSARGRSERASAPGKPDLELNERDVISPAPQAPPAVVSPEETRPPETAAGQAVPPGPGHPHPARPRPRPTGPRCWPTSRPPRRLPRINSTAVAAAQEDTDLGARPGRSRAVGSGRHGADEASNTDDRTLATRQAAAAALEELDRERLRSRANAATASLPPPRRRPRRRPTASRRHARWSSGPRSTCGSAWMRRRSSWAGRCT